MSTTVILVGDIHMRDTSPSSRVEGYREDIIAKLEYVADLAKKINADAVIWKGDVFHFPSPSKTSHATVLRMLEVIKKFKRVYVVYGNHDVSNDRGESILDKQPLGVLVQGGLRVLDGWDLDLPLYGVPWQQDWIIDPDVPERAFADWRERFEASDGSYDVEAMKQSLAITHAPIYPPKDQKSVIFELIPTSGPKSLSEAMGGAGNLAYGHIHEDHGVFEDGGVAFENVGSLARGSLHEYNLDRKIQVTIWNSEKGFIPHEIPHRPAAEIFYTEAHQENKQEKKNLDEFLQDVGSSQISISSIESVKEHINSLEIENTIKKKAVEILTEVS